MDLFNLAGSDYCWNNIAWTKLVQLGVKYGWLPSGTVLILENHSDRKFDEEWCGDYLSNSGQWVLATDAVAWADSLTKALDEIPDIATCDKQTTIIMGDYAIKVSNEKLAFSDFFSGETKISLKEFISFCRKGSFIIW
jgi:hypothetical protein